MLKQERAVRTRRSLVRTAAEEFERHGFIQARLADISAGAGVSAGALHFHFEHKAAVAAAVEETAAVALRRTARAAQLPGGTALQRLIRTTHALGRLLREDVVPRAGLQLSGDDAHDSALNLRGEWQGCVRRLVHRADAEGQLAAHVSQQDVVTVVMAVATGFERLGRRNTDWLSAHRISGFWDLVLPCVVTPGALRSLTPDHAEFKSPFPGPAGPVVRPLPEHLFSR
ncbi:ScbR family autoregulator-binding transcription factor [Actinomycetota bacterium Odt1-20B]